MNNYNVEFSRNIEVVEIETDKIKPVYEFIKRCLDIILCFVACIIALPVIMITCVFVMLESNGAPIYKQERLGLRGNPFMVYKIRSMRIDAEKHSGPKWADKDDPRVTKIGKFIRKTRIDELPQLFNILKGDMTIVGPRPERAVFTYEFESYIPGFVNRLKVKPGLTGLAQVNGGYDITPEEKLKYDLEYISKRGILLDIKIMFNTITVLFTGNGAR